MPFNQALFWFGLTAFATGLYYLWDSAVKRLHSIGLTVLGTLACAYVVYRDSHPELPAIHLWVILLIVTWTLLGYNIYLRRFRQPSVRQPSVEALGIGAEWRTGFSSPRFEIVNDHKFENEEIVVDNKSFRRCSFKNVKLLFHGRAPFEFVEGTTLDAGSVIFGTDDPAILTFNAIERKFASIPGAKIEQGALDSKGKEILLTPLTLERIDKPKELPKLVIHRATWGAAKGPGPRLDVTDKLAALVRDGLVVDVRHQNPALSDPCPGKPKRLDVEYSYGSEISHAHISRWEGNVSGLPEDTHAKWLQSRLQKAEQEGKSRNFPRHVLTLEKASPEGPATSSTVFLKNKVRLILTNHLDRDVCVWTPHFGIQAKYKPKGHLQVQRSSWQKKDGNLMSGKSQKKRALRCPSAAVFVPTSPSCRR